VFKDGED
jgi:hypothetical protein